ncbi:Gfo/Idh/MocA family protein [Parasedimentitalea psychrophila]|uniref:Gfo/Idh/MocA family oxidoreductase n=1 Tax=Parasedimentitalea psychrophila TaxID=2997337 RepID=A0A9Y2KYR1_9RHOB|nr:Gfo/Idh/MocA family oxidoreductase [Parasedimentitalea psychrophila]WIY24760.1 Gfo/Idh/MocA family oxidoreductase [Parasedimentitalea psychrophila]
MSLRVAIAGYGVAARAHAEAYAAIEEFEIVAVFSPAPETESPLIRAQLGSQVAVFDQYDEMLNAVNPDVVSICTMHDVHAEQAIKAAKAGAHIVLEKPFCTKEADLARLRHAVELAGVTVCAGFHEFHEGQFRAALDLVEQGALGALHLMEVDYLNGIGPWAPQFWWAKRRETGGSSLLVAGCHALQFLMLCKAGIEVTEVTSYANSTRSSEFADVEYDTTQISLMKFEDGSIGKVTSCIDAQQPYTFRATLVGSKGSLIDRRFSSPAPHGEGREKWTEIQARHLDDGDAITGDMYQPMFRAFLDCISQGQPMRYSDFETTMKMHRVLFAADKSAQTGRPVKISEIAC